MADSIFTKIIKGEIPSYKVYEDDKTFAFLDIHPKQPGHVLVIPKNEVDHVWDLPDEDYTALMETSKKVANRIREVIQPSRVAMQVEGTGVPHAHVHIFPFATVEEFHALGRMDKEPDHTKLAEMAKKLAF
jgi:histidine triad (HIT) family protein